MLLNKLKFIKLFYPIFAITIILSSSLVEGSLKETFSNISSQIELTMENAAFLKGPYRYQRSFGSEKISVEFPSKPSTKKEDGLLFASLKKNKIEYLFLTPTPPAEDLNSAGLFAYFLDELNTYPLEVLKDEVIHNDTFDEMIVNTYDHKCKREQKSRIIVTPGNFYVLAVEFPKNKYGSFDHFFNSFEIR
jgi:hypothetical protein